MMIKNNYLCQKITGLLKRELVILWFFGILSSLALIALQNKNKLPLGKGDFAFLVILALCVALYRPRWIFFLFVSAIALENIILAGGFLPLQLRPYQFLGAVLIAAVAILYFFKKLNFEILKPVWVDWLIFSLFPLSLLAVFNAPNKSIAIKQDFVLLSFIALYYLIRNFVRTKDDLVKTFFFFIGSFLVTTSYGFYQIFADKFGWQSFEVMFGRPNSTFTEPDWLGIFLCFALAVFLTSIFYFLRAKQKIFISKKYILLFLDILILLDTTLIILTLSRSAWVGATAVAVFYLLIILVGPQKGVAQKIHNLDFKSFAREGLILTFIIFISLAVIRVGGLSKFDILDRARSTATSEQKITIACESNTSIPASIGNVGELSKYNCRHINLEEINYYKSQGKIVTEIYRKDPNVLTRGQIYQKSWQIIKRHPVLGVGFGAITQKLGVDARGAGLNESNIFLQVWAGSGILGLIAFLGAVLYLFMHSFRKLSPVCPLQKWLGYPVVKDEFERTLAVFTVLGILALMIPNLFNAGLLMGILWLGLAIFISIHDLQK